MDKEAIIKPPTVSVMMPTYNVEKYVSQAIDSVVEQTYQDWELIIVDDGSTDGTAKILAEYAKKDSRIKVQYMAHGGRGKARNRCLELCQGKYVAVCDSDDISCPGRFKKQVNFLEQNPDIGVVSSYVCSFTIEPVFEPSKILTWSSNSEDISYAFRKHKMRIYNCAAMIRASLFKKYGSYDEELIRSQDYAWFRKLSLSGIRFLTLPEVLLFYRQRTFVPNRKYYIEALKYHYFADYRLAGGQGSLDELSKSYRMKLYMQYVNIKYLYYVLKTSSFSLWRKYKFFNN